MKGMVAVFSFLARTEENGPNREIGATRIRCRRMIGVRGVVLLSFA